MLENIIFHDCDTLVVAFNSGTRTWSRSLESGPPRCCTPRAQIRAWPVAPRGGVNIVEVDALQRTRCCVWLVPRCSLAVFVHRAHLVGQDGLAIVRRRDWRLRRERPSLRGHAERIAALAIDFHGRNVCDRHDKSETSRHGPADTCRHGHANTDVINAEQCRAHSAGA